MHQWLRCKISVTFGFKKFLGLGKKVDTFIYPRKKLVELVRSIGLKVVELENIVAFSYLDVTEAEQGNKFYFSDSRFFFLYNLIKLW